MNNNWSCLIKATAQLLDVDWKILVKEIGHDGSEILWPYLPEPTCRRAFHIQEVIVNCLLPRGKTLTPFQRRPAFCSSDLTKVHYLDEQDLWQILKSTRGVLLGRTNRGTPHAWAWSDCKIGNVQYINHDELAYWISYGEYWALFDLNKGHS